MFYRMNIAGVERDLPLCPLNSELYIAAFVMFGDVDLTIKSAEALCKIAPDIPRPAPATIAASILGNLTW